MAEENPLSPSSQAPTRLFGSLSDEKAGGPLRRLARRLSLARLARLEEGRIEILENGSRRLFGDGSRAPDLPSARIEVADGAFWERLAWGGSIGAAEAFCDGLWSSPDLTAVTRVLARNRDAMDRVDAGTARLWAPLRRLLHLFRANTRTGSLRNISAHYDTGNRFFSHFLDSTLTYSCAIFPDDASSLETAQRWKLETICRKLELGPDDRLIEIGTGWGGLAIHAARHHGCRVVTTTISQRQFEHASRAVDEAGIGDRVTLLREDYRELPRRFGGAFDKLVSVEMIEAVGHSYLPRYFEVLSRLLRPHGRALLQAILIPDQRYDRYRRSVDFIQRYIFPGGLLPSLARIQQCAARRTDFQLLDLEDLTPHYARTLAAWRRRFEAHEEEIAALGVTAPERRKWKFYFSYCEGGFLERTVGNAQILFAKPGYRPVAAPGRP